MRAVTLALTFVLGLPACGAAPSTFPNPSPGETEGNQGGTTSGPIGSFSKPDGGSSLAGDGCSDAARLVYLLSDDRGLYRFNPALLEVTLVGPLQCPGTAQPNSMAVQRDGTAWVNTTDGSLFRVDVKTAACSATGFVPGQAGYSRLGMAFASTPGRPNEETLFVTGVSDAPSPQGSPEGRGLATIDLKTLKLSPVGDFPGALANVGAELTGTGDGRLFGLFAARPNAVLAAIEPRTAKTTEVPLPGVDAGTHWAFSFWGGDFWFYTARSDATRPVNSSITRKKDSADGSIAVAKADVGFRIVGAGVSTCAPTEPPR